MVNLGLSVYWADCNVGASSPEDYGDYYAWGETETKDEFIWKTYKWCTTGRYDGDEYFTKYCTDSKNGRVDNKTTLDPEDDVAHVKWNGKWRIPTQAEMEELINNCTWTLTTMNGVSGYTAKSKINSKTIFIPAAGAIGANGLISEGKTASCWTSSFYKGTTVFPNIGAVDLEFDSNINRPKIDLSYRHCGLSVRPVADK